MKNRYFLGCISAYLHRFSPYAYLTLRSYSLQIVWLGCDRQYGMASYIKQEIPIRLYLVFSSREFLKFQNEQSTNKTYNWRKFCCDWWYRRVLYIKNRSPSLLYLGFIQRSFLKIPTYFYAHIQQEGGKILWNRSIIKGTLHFYQLYLFFHSKYFPETLYFILSLHACNTCKFHREL